MVEKERKRWNCGADEQVDKSWEPYDKTLETTCWT